MSHVRPKEPAAPAAPLVLPRWVLQVKYFGFIVFGAAVTWASSPTVEVVLGSETAVWAMAVSLSAIVCFWASFRESREPVERWSVVILASLMLVYALSPIAYVLAGDADRAAFSVIAFLLGGLPTARALMLLRWVGVPAAKHHD